MLTAWRIYSGSDIPEMFFVSRDEDERHGV